MQSEQLLYISCSLVFRFCASSQ